MARNTVELFFLGDSKSAQRAARELQDSLGKTESTAQRVSQNMARAGDRLTVGATLPLTALGLAAVKSASEAEQAVGAIESVLGSAAAKVKNFGETAADSFGLSRQEVNQLGAVLGASLKGLGFDVDTAADTVVELQQRAADLAATFGGTTSEAVSAIASLLRGERDPIERYGISIKQVDVNARAAAMGLDLSTAEAKKSGEAQAALALLMEQSADSAGQFAREADTAAGQQARAAAEAKNLAAEFGESLLPIATKVLGVVGNVASAFGDLPDPVQESIVTVGLFVAAAGPMLSIAGRIGTTFGKAAEGGRKLHTSMAALRALAGSTTPSFAAFAGAATGVGVAIGLATVAVGQYMAQQAEAKQRVEEMTATLDENTGAITENTRAHVANRLEQEGARDAAHQLGVAFTTVVDAAMGDADAQDALALATRRARDATSEEVEALGHVGREMQGAATAGGVLTEQTAANAAAAETLARAVGDEAEVLEESTAAKRRDLEVQAEQEGRYLDLQHAIDRGMDPALAALAIQQQKATAAAEDHTEAQGDLGDEVDDTTASIQEQQDAIRASRDALFATQQASEKLRDAQAKLKEVQNDTTATAEDLAAAEDDVTRAAFDLVDSSSRLVDELAETEGGIDAVIKELDGYVRAGLLTREEADKIAASFRETAGAAGELDDAVSLAARNALEALEGFRNDAGAKAELIGRAIPEGIARGASGTQQAAADAVARVVNDAIEAGRVSGEIRSPSKRADREIGAPIPEGIAEGIERGIPEVEAAMQALIDQAVEDAASGVDAILGGFRARSGRAGAQSDVAAAKEHLRELRRRQDALPTDIGIVKGWVERERERSKEITAEEEAAILRASERVSRAERDLETVRANGAATAEQLRLAELDVTLARDRLTEVQEEAIAPTRELLELQEDLKNLQIEYREIPGQIERAQEALTEAQLRAVEAEKALLKAGDDLLKQGPEGENLFRRLAEAAGIEKERIDELIESYRELARVRGGGGGAGGGPASGPTPTINPRETVAALREAAGLPASPEDDERWATRLRNNAADLEEVKRRLAEKAAGMTTKNYTANIHVQRADVDQIYREFNRIEVIDRVG